MTRSMVCRRPGCAGGEDQVTRLGRGQRRRSSEVAHLTDEDDVGVLAQHVLEGVAERPGVLPHLALVDQALVLVGGTRSGPRRSLMWSLRVRLARSTRAASVVDLPEPVGPVRARSRAADPRSSRRTAGCPGSSDLISNGMMRKAAPTESRWRYMLTRKRAAGQRVREVVRARGLELLALRLSDDRVHDALDDPA